MSTLVLLMLVIVIPCELAYYHGVRSSTRDMERRFPPHLQRGAQRMTLHEDQTRLSEAGRQLWAEIVKALRLKEFYGWLNRVTR